MKLDDKIKHLLKEGAFIPAHPLALNLDKTIDELSQRVLTQYYLASGVDGLAVGVHTTQFEVRSPEYNYYEDILRMASEEVKSKSLEKPFVMIAGICGDTPQALKEINIAKKHGYHIGLLSLGGLESKTESELLSHVKRVAKEMPIFGFYLQPNAGGRILSYEFWEKFMNIPGIYAVKTAPFNRYQTQDVLRAVCASSRRDEIAVYTGNDDNIIPDLLTSYACTIDGVSYRKEFSGGLLGHWSIWTQCSVRIFNEVKQAKRDAKNILELLQKGTRVTDVNSVLFDTKNNFKGSIAGVNYMLSKNGLMKTALCLSDNEVLSQGQEVALDRIRRDYHDLSDDAFIAKNFASWLTDVKRRV